MDNPEMEMEDPKMTDDPKMTEDPKMMEDPKMGMGDG